MSYGGTFMRHTARVLACAAGCMFAGWTAEADLVSYSGVVAGQEKVASAESVPSQRGFQYVSLSSLVQQFGGGCRVMPDRVQVDMGGNTAWINPNSAQVSGSLDRFALSHPVLNQDGDVWISTEDVGPFFGQAFRVAVKDNGKSAATTPAPAPAPAPTDPNAPTGGYTQSPEDAEALSSLEAITPAPTQPAQTPQPAAQPDSDPTAATPLTETDAEALSTLPPPTPPTPSPAPDTAAAPPPAQTPPETGVEPEMLSTLPEQLPPPAEGQPAAASVAPPGAAAPAPQQPVEPGQSLVKMVDAPQQKKRIARIIVDAGHGGGDPGCETGSGVKEKDVTLAIALQMKKIIKEVTGADVLLIRDKDAEVSLRERTNWAQSNKGDLLISVHLGASMTPSAKGVEIFCQPGGAKPRTGNGSAPAGDVYTGQSREVAEAIGAALSGAGATFRGVRETPCRLLKDAPMPGFVLEAGFVTNAEEAAALGSEAAQAQIAKCVADGILAYLGNEVTQRANAAAPGGEKKP